MKTQIKALTAITALSASLSASAMTIDFNEMATNQTSIVNVANPFQSKGFTFSTTHSLFYMFGKNDARNADKNGGTAILGHEKITMKQANGQAFSLFSIDMDDLSPYQQGVSTGNLYPHPIKFTFRYAGGTTSEKTVYLDAVGGMQTFLINEYNLLSVSWQHFSDNGPLSGSQFDNVKVNIDCGAN